MPLYTITGWNNAIWPQGEFLPVYGGYPDAPWDTKPGPIAPGEVYLFRFHSRISGDMGVIGGNHAETIQTDPQTPFLTAEVGGGIQNTYHRRPVVTPDDVTAMVPVMIGSGANMLGYYMFQGGENPDGKLGPLNESKSTGYPSDLPVKNYDFEAPLGEFGQERPSYGDLKLFNYFLNDFGLELAPMAAHAPSVLPSGPGDTSAVRIAARTSGNSGFLFVNNHVRNLEMPMHERVQIRLQLPSGPILIPTSPVDIPANSYFILPVNLDLEGLRLRYSTAQPFCRIVSGKTVLYVFFAVPGIVPELSFAPELPSSIKVESGTRIDRPNQILVSGIEPSTRVAVEGDLPSGQEVRVVVLSREQAQTATRVALADENHLVLSPQEVYSDGQSMTLLAMAKPEFHFSVWPSLNSTQGSSLAIEAQPDEGIFKSYRSLRTPRKIVASWVPQRPAKPVPVSLSDPNTVPSAQEIEAAPRWQVRLPKDAFAGADDLFLKIDYLVALLVRVLPFVATETCFALKGGTAINLFVRDLPRLSVDIDLVYLPIEDRETSLIGIRSALNRIAQKIRKAIPDSVVTDSANADGTLVLVRQRNAQIKIEVTPVLRGTVHPTELKTVRPIVEEQFGFAEIQVVSFADLYAGKLVAALDRQHPRDLFDVQHLLANEGIDDALYQAFLAYILSHNRPAHELLQPRLKDIRQAFEREFVGMTVSETSLDMLLATREQLIAEVRSRLDETSKLFLRSFHALSPDWNLTSSPAIRNLPAIRWKLMNLERLQIENPEKYQTILQQLDAALS